jgi:hypothetical protein
MYNISRFQFRRGLNKAFGSFFSDAIKLSNIDDKAKSWIWDNLIQFRTNCEYLGMHTQLHNIVLEEVAEYADLLYTTIEPYSVNNKLPLNHIEVNSFLVNTAKIIKKSLEYQQSLDSLEKLRVQRTGINQDNIESDIQNRKKRK